MRWTRGSPIIKQLAFGAASVILVLGVGIWIALTPPQSSRSGMVGVPGNAQRGVTLAPALSRPEPQTAVIASMSDGPSYVTSVNLAGFEPLRNGAITVVRKERR